MPNIALDAPRPLPPALKIGGSLVIGVHLAIIGAMALGAPAAIDASHPPATGDRMTEFAYVTVTGQDSPFFRMVPPRSRRRQASLARPS